MTRQEVGGKKGINTEAEKQKSEQRWEIGVRQGVKAGRG